MTKLNQILAVEKGAREAAADALRQAQLDLTKTGPLTGIARTYTPKNEDGDQLPSESTLVQFSVEDVLHDLTAPVGRLWDVTFTKDLTNTAASAPIVVNGETIYENVPSTFLVWFEKQLETLKRALSDAPTLDPAEIWNPDSEGVYRSEPATTTRTKKVPKTVVLYEATPEHPAQVQAFTEDIVEGFWMTTKFSGALPAERKRKLLRRLDVLIDAVKVAREQANSTEVVADGQIGSAVFDYLFDD